LLPGLISPEQEEIVFPVGHGVYAVLFEDHETEGGIVHSILMPDALRQAGLDVAEAHRIALENLERFATGDQMATQMFGQPGDEWNFLLFSQHARAAACLRLPGLYNTCRHFLETEEICACVPQRESLVILPKRDRAYRTALVARLREIEAGARRPISFELFELTPDGVVPFVEKEGSESGEPGASAP
jgi:hypothetical protein